jgi:hypothetical protein
MGLAFGCFNEFWWFFVLKIVVLFLMRWWGYITTIVGSNLQANTDNAANTNNGQININSQNLNILSSQDTNNYKTPTN